MTITKPNHNAVQYTIFVFSIITVTAYGSSHRVDYISGLIGTAFERAVTAGDIFAE